MSDGTTIEWTHRPGTKGETWNPIRARHLATGRIGWHCETVSDGCKFCYAAAQNLNKRNLTFGTGLPYKPGHRRDIEIFLDEKTLTAPLRWRDPRTIFVCSMTDAFGSFVTDSTLDRILAVAALCPQHVFIFVTKRADRMRRYVRGLPNRDDLVADEAIRQANVSKADPMHRRVMIAVRNPLKNVWLIVSTEDQDTFDERVAELRETPATVRGISAEPLLAPLDVSRHVDILDWVIAGGESGDSARPMHPDWARGLRDQCAAAGTAFFFKQWGAWSWAPEWMDFGQGAAWARSIGAKRFEQHSSGHTAMFVGKRSAGRTLDGREHDAFPQARATA